MGARNRLMQMALSDRDLHVLRWVHEMGGADMGSLAALLGRDRGITPSNRLASGTGALTRPAVYAVVARWERAGIVEKRPILRAQRPWVWLTRTGRRLIGSELATWTPRQLEHTYATCRARLAIESAQPHFLYRSDRMLRQEEGRMDALPDALLEHDGQVAVVLEVEMTQKSERRYAALLRHHARRWPTWQVWQVAGGLDGAIARAITRVADRTLQEAEREHLVLRPLAPDVGWAPSAGSGGGQPDRASGGRHATT